MSTTTFIFNSDGDLIVATDSRENLVIEDTDIIIESDIQIDYSKIYRLVDGNIVAEDYAMPQELITESKWEEVRIERNRLLTESDWTQNPDVPETTRNAWTTYRQELRDITSTYSSPEEVVWPTNPS